MTISSAMPISTPIETGNKVSDCGNSQQKHFTTIIPQKIKNSTQNFKIFHTDIFSQAKSLLNISDVVTYYGVHLNKSNLGLCPFHSERTPSFKVYPGSFYCFGCGKSGTVIDFVMKLMGLSGIDALRKLDADFRLNLPFDKPQSKEEFHQAQLQTEKRNNDKNYVQEFEAWEQRTLMNLSRRFREIHERSKTVLSPDNPNLQKHISELAEMPFIEWLLDTMIDNKHDFKRQVEFYKEYREVAARYEL